MSEKFANKFYTGNRKGLLDTGFIITSQERDHISINRNDSGIGDGDPVGIASKIFNGVAVAIEGLFDKAVPIVSVKSGRALKVERSYEIITSELQGGIQLLQLSSS